MYANLNFPELTISFKLLETPYKEHIVKTKDTVKNWRVSQQQRPHVLECNQKVIDENWNILKNNYYKLCAIYKVKPKYQLPIKFDNTNYWLNILHRYFTTCFTYHTCDDVKLEINNEILKIINEINDSVHEIENFVETKTKLKFKNRPVKWLEIIGDPNSKHNLFVLDDFLKFTSQNYNVYAIKHITGKDFLTAFFDEDTSNSWDITNYHITYIGFTIDVYGDLHKLWNNTEFRKWIIKHGYLGPIGYFPVGNINQSDLKYLQTNFYNLKIENVTFST